MWKIDFEPFTAKWRHAYILICSLIAPLQVNTFPKSLIICNIFYLLKLIMAFFLAGTCWTEWGLIQRLNLKYLATYKTELVTIAIILAELCS